MSDIKRYQKGPFRADFDGGYIFCRGPDGKDDFVFGEVRGWGQLQYQPDPAETQDANLQFMVDALNEKAAREAEELKRQAYQDEQTKKREKQAACEHKNRTVYKDYYSKITTCKDCGIEW